LFVIISNQLVIGNAHASDTREELLVLGLKCLTHRHGDDGACKGPVRSDLGDHASGDAAVACVIMIKGKLVGDPQSDDQRDSHAGGKAGNIDKGGGPALPEVAPGDAHIVFEHSCGSYGKEGTKKVPE